MNAIYYERRYCKPCLIEHWVAVDRAGHETCPGEHYTPHNDTTHYTRRKGKGIEVVETRPTPEPIPLEWQIAFEARQLEEVDF